MKGKGRKAATVKWPSRVVMFVDGNYGRCTTSFTDYGGDNWKSDPVDPFHSRSAAARGKGAVNFVACDGHAESFRALVKRREVYVVPDLGLELEWRLPEYLYRVDGGGHR
jgi:prepilin-type processing-associated H-X9-DG protein